MSILRPFRATDLFEFNNVNIDVFTETYSIQFYLSYLSRWPSMCIACLPPSGKAGMAGYVIGKSEGNRKDHHGHVTALTVAPEYRHLGLASSLMADLEKASDIPLYEEGTLFDLDEEGNAKPRKERRGGRGNEAGGGYFVDLFVRCNNHVGITLYEKLGYTVYRRVEGYYTAGVGGKGGKDEEDAFDMRKPLSLDTEQKSIRENGREFLVDPSQVWF